MAESADSVEDRLSCNDSSYNERNLEGSTAEMVFIVEVRTRNTAMAVQSRWEWSLTSLNLLTPYTTRRAAAARTTT